MDTTTHIADRHQFVFPVKRYIVAIVFIPLAIGSTGIAPLAAQQSAATITKQRVAETKDAEASTEKKLSLTIDFGDGSQWRFTNIQWTEESTVMDALRQAERHPRGIQFKYRGENQTAFLEEIEGLANEGADGRNWMFKVSGKIAKQSFATTKLQANDDILWEFR